jgi:hypothetical protein
MVYKYHRGIIVFLFFFLDAQVLDLFPFVILCMELFLCQSWLCTFVRAYNEASLSAASVEVHLRPSFAYMPETHLLTSKVSRFEDLRQSSPPTLIIIHNFFLILVFDKKGEQPV